MTNHHLTAAIILLPVLSSMGAAQATARSDTGFTTPIEVSSNGATLRATMHVAAGSGPRPTVVSIKGFPGNNSQDFPTFLRSRGFNAVAINLRGQLESDGQYTVGGSPSDAAAVVSYLREDHARRTFGVDPDRIIIVGTSAGSFAALRAAASDASIKCVALIVPFNWTLAGVSARSDAGRQDLEAAAQRITQQSPPPVRLSDTFVQTLIDSAETFDLRKAAAGLTRRNVLMVGAKNDATAPMSTHFEPVVSVLRGARAVVRDTTFEDSHNLPNSLPAIFDLFARWASACARQA
jgi:pimeloyl-ACP methyl ester carboxylesterase